MATTTTNEDEKSALESMETSRLEVMECEKEIQSIKNELKSLPLGSGSAESTLNCLRVSIHRVTFSGNAESSGDEGVSDSTVGTSISGGGSAPPTTFKLHISSPIEERTIKKLFDPLDPTAEGSIATFERLETPNALLTIEAFSNRDNEQIKLGVSAAHDLLPLCEDLELWKSGGEKKSSMVDFAIIAEAGLEGAPGGSTNAAAESKAVQAEALVTTEESEEKEAREEEKLDLSDEKEKEEAHTEESKANDAEELKPAVQDDNEASEQNPTDSETRRSPSIR